jgi:hypothetical protein
MLSNSICQILSKEFRARYEGWVFRGGCFPDWLLERGVPGLACLSTSPADHCSHHEALAPVNALIEGWIASQVCRVRIDSIKGRTFKALI